MVESQPSINPTPVLSSLRGTFVGRQREMAELRDALDSAVAGYGQSVMMAGEPGIGKTRTAQELGSHAAALGVKVLWGWCHEREGAPPYWPWIQSMRSYIQELDSAELRSQMGPGASDIAQIVPELRQLLPDLEPSPNLEPEQARFRLFDSITTFLKNAAQSQPLLLVLDDLHWADPSSLMLWEFVSKEISNARVMLLGTYRDVEVGRRHPLSQVLGSLIREPSFRRVRLGGLSKQEVSRLVELSAGVTLAEPSLDLIHSRTQGNPLFLSELVRLSGEESIGAGDSWTSALPEGIKDIIGRRLDRLSVQCNDTLTVASVIGREFSLEQLKPLIDGLAEDALLEVLEEAQSARVIEESPGSGDRFRFAHALIQDTVGSELTTARRVRLHSRIAQALEQLYGANAEAHAAELAHHFAEAEAVLGTEKLVRYSLMAGEQALAAYAHEEALVHFQRALAAKEGQPMDAETAAMLFGLGRAQVATLDPLDHQEALANLARAFDYYEETKEVDRAVAVAQFPVQSSLSTGRDTGVMQLVTRALTLVPIDSREAGRLLCQYGNILYYQTGDFEGAIEALSQALAIARREGDATLEMRTLVAAGHAEASHLHFQESLEYDLQAIKLSGRVDDPFEETHARQEVASVLHRTGDLEGARRHAAAMLEVAETLRHRTRLWQALQANTVVSFLEGDWQTARSLSDRALGVSPRNPNLLGFRAIIEYNIGNFEDGETYIERLMEAMQRSAPGPTFEYAYPAIVIPLVAQVTGFDNRLEHAESAAQVVLSSPWVTPVLASLASAGLGLLAVTRGDAAAAEQQYGVLRPRQGTMLGGLLDSIISADRILGLLAQTAGLLDSAILHTQEALAFCRKAGYRPELAWTCCDCADSLLQRKESGDGAKAILLLDESLAISQELGMRPLMQRVNALKEKITSQPPAVAAYPAALTRREVEVLRLVASGKTSAEIAADLVLSRRTVERHITNIYSKTKARSRAEATAFAFNNGLVSSS